jgi:uncharacterized protein YjbI with pentapeptide repeats
VDWSESVLGLAQFYHARLQHCLMTGIVAEAANFGGSKLDHCDYSRAHLDEAKFVRSEIIQCIFRDASLHQADFRDVRFRGGDFSRAALKGARFGGALLHTADFRGANLLGARELSPEQLQQALTDDTTILPNGKRGPYLRYSGAEKPVNDISGHS